jgi:Zn-dependent protease
MDIYDGLIQYLMLIALLTFHEFGHAWMAWKCGDDTARLQGRVSLNPVVHMDPIGTVFLPLFMIFGPNSIARYVLGYAKPVPVNPYNLRNPQRDDILVTLAGPGMNLLLAVLLVALARVGVVFQSGMTVDLCLRAADLSLVLCFFNLIPIPPLDGSQVMRVLTGMSYEAYAQIARYGFIMVIVVLQIPFVGAALNAVTQGTLLVLLRIFGVY